MTGRLAKASRYPQQIAVVKRSKVTLGIDANLELADTAKNSRGEEIAVPPLTMHGPYSCFRWTLIDKSGSGVVYPSANIPSREVATLRTKVNAVIGHNTIQKPRIAQQPGKGESQGAAYTVKIRMNKFKGRTPAAVLLENPDSLSELQGIVEFLRSQGRESRYWESNQQQIQAIEEAIGLLNRQELSAESVDDSSGATVVYHRPQKVLLNRPPKGDHYFTYSIKIECLAGYEYPWHISIANAYMRVKKKSDGTHETIPNTAIEKAISQLQISDYEMGYVVERMYSTLANFDLIFFKKQYTESVRQYQELLDNFRSEQPGKAA